MFTLAAITEVIFTQDRDHVPGKCHSIRPCSGKRLPRAVHYLFLSSWSRAQRDALSQGATEMNR